jgi:RsiW-degrading membrane proteinase PrsW (M82 family)
MASALTYAVGIVLLALLPSLYYLVRARDSERYGREPYGRLLAVFGFGAITAVVISIILELVIVGNLHMAKRLYELGDTNFLAAVVVAPIVEEAAKALGVVLVMAHFSRAEDGLVYGVAAGLGFAATENLLYEMSALEAGGLIAYFATVVVRSISSTLLHASATGVTGLGIGKAQVAGRSLYVALPYYVGAVLMHSAFNLFAGLNVTIPGVSAEATSVLGLVICVVFATLAFRLARERLAS